jgi:peroxiredoxin
LLQNKKYCYMKYLLLTMAMLATAFSSQAQVKYSVAGVCPDDAATVYVYDLSDHFQLLDSVAVSNGRFALYGQAAANALIGLGVDDGNTVSIFFNDGQPVQADLITGIIRSSEVNNRLNDYDRRLDSISGLQNALGEELLQLTDNDGNPLDGCEQQVVDLMKRMQAQGLDEMATYAAIIGEKDNLIPVVYLDELVNLCNAMGNEEIKAQLLSPERPYYNYPMGRETIERIMLDEKLQHLVGQRFIDLEEPDMDGRMHRLSDYCGRGNYVLVDFWASWCGPCMAEMPNVKANYEKYHAKGFQIVGLSFDQKAEAWKKAVRDKGLYWIHLSDLQGWQSEAAEVYNINSIPSSLLIDPEGTVIARDLRGSKLGDKLKEIYGF